MNRIKSDTLRVLLRLNRPVKIAEISQRVSGTKQQISSALLEMKTQGFVQTCPLPTQLVGLLGWQLTPKGKEVAIRESGKPADEPPASIEVKQFVCNICMQTKYGKPAYEGGVTVCKECFEYDPAETTEPGRKRS